MADDDNLKKLVHEALDRAIANGYESNLAVESDEDVAINVIDYDADVGALQPDVMDVIPHVRSWRDARAN